MASADTFNVSAGMPEHPKIEGAGGDAAWLWLCALAYSRRNKTDGIVPASKMLRLSDRKHPDKLTRRLIDARLMHEPGHDCDRCPQPLPGSLVVHDYLDWQRSAGEDDDTQQAKVTGGAYGNHRRWHVGRGQLDPACLYCIASGSVNGSHNRSESDRITDPSTESDANRIAIGEATDAIGEPPSPPQTPPYPRVDITPPTPPAAEPKKRRRTEKYNYGSDLDFLRFWEVFPAKRGKPDAYEAWLSALRRGADPEQIISAAKRYADDPMRNPAKTKYPQGWLNAERYDDGGQLTEQGRNYDF